MTIRKFLNPRMYRRYFKLEVAGEQKTADLHPAAELHAVAHLRVLLATQFGLKMVAGFNHFACDAP